VLHLIWELQTPGHESSQPNLANKKIFKRNLYLRMLLCLGSVKSLPGNQEKIINLLLIKLLFE
jgi:hypothetical protein